MSSQQAAERALSDIGLFIGNEHAHIIIVESPTETQYWLCGH